MLVNLCEVVIHVWCDHTLPQYLYMLLVQWIGGPLSGKRLLKSETNQSDNYSDDITFA